MYAHGGDDVRAHRTRSRVRVERSDGDDEARARERFARELQRYASDEDDDNVATTTPATAAPSSRPARSFFDVAADDDNDEGGERASRRHAPAGTAQHVGRSLLARMQADDGPCARRVCSRHAGDTNATAPVTRARTAAASSYTPLSSGGFMDTSAEYGNVHRIRVGDVVYFRNTATTSSNSDTNDNNDGSSGSSDVSSPTSRIVSRSGDAAAAAAAETSSEQSAASALATHFCRESALSDEERRYGRRLTHAMLREMGEVTRLDKTTHSLEVQLLDGTRVRRRLYDVRPAGYVEQALYADWKAHPQHRPARVIAGSDKADSNKQSDTHATTTTTTASPARPWWVLPRLVVRVTAADATAAEWRGRVCVVVAVRRKDNVVRLTPYTAPVTCSSSGSSNSSSSASLSACVGDDDVVEVRGQDGLTTVVPPCGESGIVVLGDRRGEQVVVLRTRVDTTTTTTTADDNNNGNALPRETVTVLLRRTGEQLDLAPHEVCMLDTASSKTA